MIDKIMENQNATFYIKKHPFDKRTIELKGCKNIVTLSKEIDIQEILPFVDVLITDYSSVFFDFMILNRPIILYCYDLDKYKNKRGFIIDFDNILSKLIVKNKEEFIERLININKAELFDLDPEIKKLVLSEEVLDSCCNIFDYIESH